MGTIGTFNQAAFDAAAANYNAQHAKQAALAAQNIPWGMPAQFNQKVFDATATQYKQQQATQALLHNPYVWAGAALVILVLLF